MLNANKQIGEKAGKAGVLLFMRKVWAGVLNLFVISYLARVLSKEDFGLISVSAAFLSIMDLLGPSSIGDFIIYKNDKKNFLTNGAFWLNFMLTILVLVVVVLITPLWAGFYNDARIVNVVYILSVVLVSNFIASVPTAILKQRFDFTPIILAQTISGTLSQLTMLAMAIIGFGVYSMAVPSAIFSFIAAVYLFIKVKPQIKLNFEKHHWKEIWTYARYWIGGKVLGRIATDGDNLIIGKTLGLTSLGVYNIASRFSNLLNQNLMPILEDIGLPLFSKYNHNYNIIRKQFLYVSRLTALLLVPVYCMIILFAHVIIETLFSDKWYDAVMPLRILCVFSLIESITYSTGILYNALGKPGIKYYFALIYTPIFFIAVWFFSMKGLIVACITITTLRVANFTWHIFKAGKIIDLSPFRFLKEILHVIVPNMLLGICYLVILYYLHNTNVKYIMMVAYIPAIYFISYYLFKKDILKDYIIVTKLFPRVKTLFS